MDRELLKATIKHKFTLILFFLFLLNNCLFSQNKDSITYIAFDLQHTLRIPDHHLIINITKDSEKTLLHLSSFPMKQFEKKYPKTDTTFTIENSEFAKLAQSVSLLNNLDKARADVRGFDGVYCKIKYGSANQNHSYNIWSPDVATDQRGLNDYFNACFAIVKAAHLPLKIITE